VEWGQCSADGMIHKNGQILTLKLYSVFCYRLWPRFLGVICGYKSVITREELLRVLPRGRMTGAGVRAELFGPALKHQRSVGSAEAEGVRKRVVEAGLAGVVGYEVHAGCVWILIVEVDGGRENLIAQGEN